MWLKYLGHTLLLQWLGDCEPETQPGFVINTIENISFDGDRPMLRGKARKSGIAVAYQDD